MSKRLSYRLANCLILLSLFTAGCEGSLNPGFTGKESSVGPMGPPGAVGEQGIAGATGRRGHVGATGERGPAGPDAGMVEFNMMVSAVRNFDFAFFPSNMGGQSPVEFDPSTTNASNRPYSAFLVPFDGTISDLTIRADVRAIADATPNFTFTVYESAATPDSPASTIGWTATALAKSTGAFAVPSSTSSTAVSQNLSDTVSVTAGSLLTVVVSGTGYGDFDLQPAKFAVSFRYTPNT